MAEENIEYSKMQTSNIKENITILCINKIPNTFVFEVSQLYELSLHIIEKGTLKLVFDQSITDDLFNKIKINSIFAGFINIAINTNKTEISFVKKDWPNNKTNDYKNFNAKMFNEEEKGVDESHLIDPYSLYKPKLKYYPCSNAKPCANCTCGRAEMNKKKEINDIKIKDNKGGCGRCHLGDEFRCANCPYRGLPAFNIDENKNKEDGKQEIEKVNLNVQNNVVKIDI